ncbi:transposase [Streptomyces canus]|nr:transposase [Streptomyces canus]
MNCRMSSGSSFGRCPSRRGAGSGRTKRTVLNGIVWKIRTGTAWRDCASGAVRGPHCTPGSVGGSWPGTFERMIQAAQARADAAGDIDWLVSVDSTVVRSHRHAAGARKEGSAPGTRTLPRWPGRQDSPGVRLPGVSARLPRRGREHQRLHPVHRCDGRDTSAPPRARAPASGPTTSSATRATAPKRSGPGSGGGASATPSRNGPTRSSPRNGRPGLRTPTGSAGRRPTWSWTMLSAGSCSSGRGRRRPPSSSRCEPRSCCAARRVVRTSRPRPTSASTGRPWTAGGPGSLRNASTVFTTSPARAARPRYAMSAGAATSTGVNRTAWSAWPIEMTCWRWSRVAVRTRSAMITCSSRSSRPVKPEASAPNSAQDRLRVGLHGRALVAPGPVALRAPRPTVGRRAGPPGHVGPAAR